MENYTKYKLKSKDELSSLLDGKDRLFLIACNKCFKEFAKHLKSWLSSRENRSQAA